MRIGGFVKTSFVDYPGKIAAVIFTRGCNLNCSYCHNRDLLNCEENIECIQCDGIVDWLMQRRDLVDAVVISGGEPTLQKNLYKFIRKLKSMNLYVKLDTNGTNPSVLKPLIAEKLLDFIAMDIKAPLNKYQKVCGVEHVDLSAIEKSIKIIKTSGVSYEFRTTLCSELEDKDVLRIISDLKVSENYVVQNCRDYTSIQGLKNKRNVKLLKQKFGQREICSFRGFSI